MVPGYHHMVASQQRKDDQPWAPSVRLLLGCQAWVPPSQWQGCRQPVHGDSLGLWVRLDSIRSSTLRVP